MYLSKFVCLSIHSRNVCDERSSSGFKIEDIDAKSAWMLEVPSRKLVLQLGYIDQGTRPHYNGKWEYFGIQEQKVVGFSFGSLRIN